MPLRAELTSQSLTMPWNCIKLGFEPSKAVLFRLGRPPLLCSLVIFRPREASEDILGELGEALLPT